MIIKKLIQSIKSFIKGTPISKFSNWEIVTLITITLSFFSCGSGDKETKQPMQKKTPLVKVQPAVKAKMVSFIDITGTIQANVVSEVKSPVDGVIESLYARENQQVSKDRIIAVINPNDRVALIANNQVQIHELERKIKSSDSQSGTYRELVSELEKAKSNEEYANKMFRTVPVICPMNGMVTYRWLDAGSQVGAKEKIITISDMGSLVIKAEVNEKYFDAIKQGKKLPVLLSAYPNDTLLGAISLIYPQIDPTTRSVKFDVKLQSKGKKLLPGMMATLRIPVSTSENAISVNPDAVLTGSDNSSFLFIADKDSMVHKRIVKTGISTDKKTEIVQGLKENEKVVVMGQEMLKDSMKVKIANLKMK